MHGMRRRGMSLVELLVVMTIIVIIGLLVLSALMRGPRHGVETRTQVDVASLSMAVGAYFGQYGEWPVTNETAYAMDAGLTAMLCGETRSVDGQPRNLKQIAFLPTLRAEAVGPTGWTDPWGKRFFFAVDQDGDGIITAPVIERGRFGAIINHGTLVVTGRQVIAFSFGPNTNLNLSVSDPVFDDIRSW